MAALTGEEATQAVVPVDLTLHELAEGINAEHGLCEKSFRAGVEHAVNAGKLLIQAKTLCAHGSWGDWLRENCTVSERTAQAYMRVARGFPVLKAKAQHVADLTFREAVALLAEPKLGQSEARAQLNAVEAHIEASRIEIRKLAEGLSARQRLDTFCEFRERLRSQFDFDEGIIAEVLVSMLAEELRIGLTETDHGLGLVALV